MKNSDLEHRVQIINNRFGCKLGLDWAASRPRLGRADKPGCIGRFIGPRMTKAQMMFYLDAFEEGCQEVMRPEIIMEKLKDVAVTCKFCGKWTQASTAHRHEDGWVGDDCCWDERLRSTE